MSSPGFINPTPVASRRIGLIDVPLALLSPKRVFARVEDVPAYGWSLVVLLLSVTLIGFAEVQTGLIDRKVARHVEQGIAQLEKQQYDVVERSALTKMIEEKRKEGEFLHLMERVRVIVANPIGTLASVLLLSAFFYALVALGGRKPEWHTLLTILVFAGFVDVISGVVRLGFMLRFRTLDIETSLASLARMMPIDGEGAAQATAAVTGLLSAADPFRIWFWVVVATGLTVTSQLRGWKAWAGCTLCWITAAAIRTLVSVASVGPGASA